MSFILDIATAVPDHIISKEKFAGFYLRSLPGENNRALQLKLAVLNRKMSIDRRYSCIPDFMGADQELYLDGNFNPAIEQRLALFREKLIPLSCKAIDKLLERNPVHTDSITHLITVSCTGLYAPGFEFGISEHYGLQAAERTALNFLGCYAGVKALKHAHQIAQGNPDACILIVCTELCSLHYFPSASDEDITANLLFADGTAAVLVCGENYSQESGVPALRIDEIGSGYIPNTFELMTWDISSSAFRMFLSRKVVNAIRDNIGRLVDEFMGDTAETTNFWAIHPGGVRIVDAIRNELGLTARQVEETMAVLKEYGNMSSPTVLFILERIFNKKKATGELGTKVFSCAFGPGLSVEMIRMQSAEVKCSESLVKTAGYAL